MELQRQNSVQRKIGCLFETQVEDKASSKHQNQPFRVTASNRLNPDVTEHDLIEAKATEKLDGTCSYITEFEGKPWLWARHDRKPNKAGDRKLKKHLQEKDAWRNGGKAGDKPAIVWDVIKDFKDVPENWMPALEVAAIDGVAQPDEHGHIPGWVPVDPKGRQHLWHLSAVDLNKGLGLVLRQTGEGGLRIDCVPLSDLQEQTVELVGTNVNGNPYKLGTKQQPVHLLVVHGSIVVDCPHSVDRDYLVNWLEYTENGQVEGIVWHCSTGSMFKLHRHHVNLPWPIDNPRLSKQQVTINVDGSNFEFQENEKCQFYLLSKHHGSTCEQLDRLHDLIYGPAVEDVKVGESKAWRYFKVAAPIVAGAVIAPLAVPVALGAAGFGTGGIVAGSLAARAMSAAAIANGGGVAAGSAVAVCQSIGAAGLSAGGTAIVSSVGAGISAGAVGIWKGATSLFGKKTDDDVKEK